MKKKKITYGVPGMMEYHTSVSIGKSKVNVSFTDGSSNAMSMVPAMFTTDNLMLQIAIEASTDYRRGRIVTVREIELQEEVRVKRNINKAEPAESEEGVEAEPAESKEEESEGVMESSPASGKLEEVYVNVNDDAKDYLEVNYGVNRSKLRNRAEIQDAAAGFGIVFVFAK